MYSPDDAKNIQFILIVKKVLPVIWNVSPAVQKWYSPIGLKRDLVISSDGAEV
jgi:hypothetical protein